MNWKSLRNLSAAALMISALASCSPDDNMPVSSGQDSYGAMASKNMSDYYYPKSAGYTYVYKQTINEYNSTGSTLLDSWTGSYDTLRTLGYQGYSTPDGDSVFAFNVTYRILSDRNTKNKFALYYLPKSSLTTGGFMVNNNPNGVGGLDSVMAVATAIDTILYAVEGPVRDYIDNVQSSGTRTYRTDKIFFSSKGDAVNIWWKDGSSIRETRLVWNEDFKKNNPWQYASPAGDPYTYWEVRDKDQNISTDAGDFQTAKIQAYTQSLNTPATEYKWFGAFTGLVKQYDEWMVTSDGQTFKKRTKTRELMSISH